MINDECSACQSLSGGYYTLCDDCMTELNSLRQLQRDLPELIERVLEDAGVDYNNRPTLYKRGSVWRYHKVRATNQWEDATTPLQALIAVRENTKKHEPRPRKKSKYEDYQIVQAEIDTPFGSRKKKMVKAFGKPLKYYPEELVVWVARPEDEYAIIPMIQKYKQFCVYYEERYLG